LALSPFAPPGARFFSPLQIKEGGPPRARGGPRGTGSPNGKNKRQHPGRPRFLFGFFTGGEHSVRDMPTSRWGQRMPRETFIGGKHLLVGSIELEGASARNWGAAVFYDTENAFDDFGSLNLARVQAWAPLLYAGGPIRLDLARQVGACPIRNTGSFHRRDTVLKKRRNHRVLRIVPLGRGYRRDRVARLHPSGSRLLVTTLFRWMAGPRSRRSVCSGQLADELTLEGVRAAWPSGEVRISTLLLRLQPLSLCNRVGVAG